MDYDYDFIEGYLVERVTDTHIYLDRNMDPAGGRNSDIIDHPLSNKYELRDDWMYHDANYLDDVMAGKADDWEFHPD